MWNELVKVIKYDKVEEEDKNYARLLLSHLDTAGGIHFLRKEITYFLENMVEKYGEIPTKITIEQKLKETIDELENFKQYWANKPKCRDEIIMISKRVHEYFNEIKYLENQIEKYK